MVDKPAKTMNRGQVLEACRQRLGIIQGVKRETVAKHVAFIMGMELPRKDLQWHLISKFLDTPTDSPRELYVLANYADKIHPKPLKGIHGHAHGRPVIPPRAKRPKKRTFVVTDEFLLSYEWRKLRMVVITKRGPICECCGASPKTHGTRINVDHIKPRKLFPELALVESNLQILCEECNHGKGNWDQTDWRAASTTQGMLEDSPVPGTATVTSIASLALRPRLVRRR